jgi:hypothetical protein
MITAVYPARAAAWLAKFCNIVEANAHGRLNQLAYSLFLFIRDVADGDFVGWIDRRLADADFSPASNREVKRGRLQHHIWCECGSKWRAY